MTKIIALTQGKETIVDDQDFDWLSKWKWWCLSGKYAVRTEWPSGKKIYMHREIMKTPDGMETDHISGKGLDNRRCNLRNCTSGENNQNCNHHSDGSSIYKGVGWSKQKNKWRARIKTDGKEKHLGFYDKPEDAARAYNVAAEKYFKDFARLNKTGE